MKLFNTYSIIILCYPNLLNYYVRKLVKGEVRVIKPIVFEESIHNFLAERVLEIGPIIIDILEFLHGYKEGFYHEEIIRELEYSDTIIRPAIYSLYSVGFIDKTKKGNMKFYIINQNGLKLLNKIKGDEKNEIDRE